AYPEEFDHRPCPNEGMVTAELMEDARQRAISLRINLAQHDRPVACRHNTQRRVMAEVVDSPPHARRCQAENIYGFRGEENPLTRMPLPVGGSLDKAAPAL
ncbi:MAG: hypothetical protein ACRDOH_04340, partial [Streptosporangiaceae bacterium]